MSKSGTTGPEAEAFNIWVRRTSWYIYGPADSLEVKRTLITIARHDRRSHVAGLHSTKRIPHQSQMDTQQRGRKSKSHPIVR